MSNSFTCFDYRQKYEIIQTFLQDQIDLDELKAQQIIKDHYALHKISKKNKVIETIRDYWWALFFKLISESVTYILGIKWKKNMEMIHLIKKYFGEKYAIYYMF